MKPLILGLLCFAHSITGFAIDPDRADVAYGNTPSMKLDIYMPDGQGPFPVVMYIHGGGWWNGDKKYISEKIVKRYLGAGIAVVSINYMLLPQAMEKGLYPPVSGPFNDAKRALQFIRYHAPDWGLDPYRIALSGGSAGGCSALWLGLSPDMKDPGSDDPVEQMSTRVTAIGVYGAQTSLDPVQMREWVGPELAYGGHAFGLNERDFELFLEKREEFTKYFPSLSPAALLSSDDPPVFLEYSRSPDQANKDHMYYVHSPGFGLGFQKLARQKGVTCYLSVKGYPPEAFDGDAVDFNIFMLGQ